MNIPPMVQLMQSYCCACGGAVGTAVFLNSKVKNMKPVFAKLVPFAAVCAANFINIPMMRSSEIIKGAPIFTPDGKQVGVSKNAAKFGIGTVCLSRCIMAIPGMTLTPAIMSYATKQGWFCNYPSAALPFQMGLVALCVGVATPLCCALFKQQASYPVDSLEKDVQDYMKKKFPKVKEVTFNKGL